MSIELKAAIEKLALDNGFEAFGVTKSQLESYAPYYRQWVARGFHGGAPYLTKHGNKRLNPFLLFPQARSILMVRFNYLPPEHRPLKSKIEPHTAQVARYAFGQDYHDVLRKKLKDWAKAIEALPEVQALSFKAFVDSGPILEKPLAVEAGLGWQGRNGLLIHPDAGSWFFLGSLITNIELPEDGPMQDQCGKCRACINYCPTGAIVGDKIVDSMRCLAYLSIEYQGVIEERWRKAFGTRIFGCDDCQLICPWNRYAKPTREAAFWASRGLESPDLLKLYSLTEQQYQTLFDGSPLKRPGYAAFLRNVAIAIGNSPYRKEYEGLLQERALSQNLLIAEHASWALAEQRAKKQEESIF